MNAENPPCESCQAVELCQGRAANGCLGLKNALEHDGLGECWICGNGTYDHSQKCHGFQETPDGELQLICSVCFQVQCTINKDSLHGPNCNGSPFVRMYLVSETAKPRKVVGYQVLDHEPWLEKFGELEKAKP